jgi:CRISPR-associated protein Cmr2
MMDELMFWKQKIIQALHDPPAKPYAFFPGAGGHVNSAKHLFKLFTGEPMRFYARRPDLAASGADRPVLSRPRGEKGQYGLVPFYKAGNDLITHPLSDFPLRLGSTRTQPLSLEGVEELLARQGEIIRKLGSTNGTGIDGGQAGTEGAASEPQILEDEIIGGEPPQAWNDLRELRSGFLRLWRRFRDDLAAEYEAERLLWERMPGDSRIPDHSIWEHLKVASALAFLNSGSGAKVSEEKEPWLFNFALYPVQSFIEESRTSRDLWVSSFLIADLAWHAMKPIVEHYGPDVIIYPDLRANPRVDNWLYRDPARRDALPESLDYPATYAAVLPNTFTAILPGGGKEHLRPIDEIALECGKSVQDRWRELETLVSAWLAKKTNTSRWEEIWRRQHSAVFTSYWTAVHWQIPSPIKNEAEFKMLTIGGALPSQDPEQLPAPSPATVESASRREKRLTIWMTPEVWGQYERARAVFGRVNLGYVQNERGFDYALTHHELRMRQRIRKQEAKYPLVPEEPGEKCTQCRKREALWGAEGGSRGIDARRQLVREFWQNLWERIEEPDRTDRLCAVCAFKRFLVEAGKDDKEKGLGPIYLDPEDSDQEANVPFPSTGAVAAQEFLFAVATSDSLDVRQAVSRVVSAHRATGLKRTLWPKTLPRLLDARHRSPLAREFLTIDPQESIFPDAIQTLIDRAKRGDDAELEKLLKAVKKLRDVQAKEAKNRRTEIPDAPDAHIGVLRMDVDRMGHLLLGDAERIGAKWREVIHPWVVKKIEEKEELKEAGWASLLDAPRLMGPSLHAFISRTLADFSHRIIPWVVEQEYGGRLIYSGGDDVLALAPARDALEIAARLQQLISAAWIIDTRFNEQPWSWRRGSGAFDRQQARRRFIIPKAPHNGEGKAARPIEFPLGQDDIEPAIGLDGVYGQPDGPFQVVSGLGANQSFSASIVYGHYKTQLSLLLRDGRRLLDETAKETEGRAAVALSHRSRGGSKSEIALKWRIRGSASREPVKAYDVIASVVKAFQERSLPGRLPYKLRSVAPLLLVEDDETSRERLAWGLLVQALDGASPGEKLEAAVLTLWMETYKFNVKLVDVQGRPGSEDKDEAAERSVDGLLLCRYLAGHGTEDQA